MRIDRNHVNPVTQKRPEQIGAEALRIARNPNHRNPFLRQEIIDRLDRHTSNTHRVPLLPPAFSRSSHKKSVTHAHEERKSPGFLPRRRCSSVLRTQKFEGRYRVGRSRGMFRRLAPVLNRLCKHLHRLSRQRWNVNRRRERSFPNPSLPRCHLTVAAGKW